MLLKNESSMENKFNKLKDLKIIIFTRSCNRNLFELSGKTINLPFERKRIKYASADGYFYEILKSDADIAINLDEDAFVIDNKSLLELLVYMIDNDFANCGFPDGGVLPIRYHNPLITNPFFNILDLRKIRNKFSMREMKRYKTFKESYKVFAPLKLIRDKFSYDMYEPYYPFFLWISQNFKVLYLNATTHPDGFTTILKNHTDVSFLLHSWYSRCYEVDTFHTNRINQLINECGIFYISKKNNRFEKIFNKYFFSSQLRIRYFLSKFNII